MVGLKVSDMSQKTKNNLQLLAAGILVVVTLEVVWNTMIPEELPPWDSDAKGWRVFFYFGGLVLAFSMLSHLFLFSIYSALPLRRLVLSAALLQLAFVIPPNVLHVALFIWRIDDLDIYWWLLLFFGLLFIGGELFLLGRRPFAPLFKRPEIIWRIPVVALSGVAAWVLGFAGFLGFIAAGGI